MGIELGIDLKNGLASQRKRRNQFWIDIFS